MTRELKAALWAAVIAFTACIFVFGGGYIVTQGLGGVWGFLWIISCILSIAFSANAYEEAKE